MRNKMFVLALVASMAAMPLGLIGMLALIAWLSVGTSEFGPWDLRYLFLVSGTTVARLDLIEPMGGSVHYSARGEDGTSPPYIIVDFKTAVSPERVIEIYEARCVAIGLSAQRKPQENGKLVLDCNDDKNELGVYAWEVDRETAVAVGGWVD